MEKRSMTKYRLILGTTGGMYESDTLLGLLLEIFRHRLYHLFRHRKWMD